MLKEIVREYWSNRPMELAAALSYYTLLSLAPLVLVTVSLAGLVFERAAVEGRVVAEIRALVGHEGADVVHTVMRNAHDREKGAISIAIGVVLLLAGATTVFVQLQTSLNRIWKVDTSLRLGAIHAFIKERLLSLAMVLGIGFLLLVSLLANTALTALGDSARTTVGDSAIFLHAVNSLGSFAIITGLFAMIFKVLPDAPVAWRDVWIGAALTSILFTLGKSVLGIYLGRAGIGSAYGAAGSLVVMTVWVYYASLILFFGAELTYLRSKHTQAAAPAGQP